MAKIMIECSDVNDLDALYQSVENQAGRCNVTYFKQHEEMVKAGTSKSIRDSARKMAAETGESEAAIKHRILRGKANGPRWSKKSKAIETIKEKETPAIIENRKPQGGGKRSGAGRPKEIISQEAMWRNVEMQLDKITEYIEKNYEEPTRAINGTKGGIINSIETIRAYFD